MGYAMGDRDSSEQPGTGKVSTAQVLAEVERRMAEARHPARAPQAPVTMLADRAAFWFSKHWLVVFNTFFFLYVGLPFLAPVLMHLGAERAAGIVYLIYRPLCHQLPQRSFFLFGPQFAYTVTELMEHVGTSIGPDLATRAFIGDEAIGYKMALCQRDTAIYGTILLLGLLYGVVRRYWKVPPLPFWAYVVFGVVPMLLDGGYQFISYIVPLFWPEGAIAPRETTPTLRVITGSLFGLATVWLSYPLVQETMLDIGESLRHKLAPDQQGDV
jgi:uncharacterized membrane protein